MRTSRFHIRFAETKRIQQVDATELERMIRDGEIGDDDLVALGGQFKRYWEHPRFASCRPEPKVTPKPVGRATTSRLEASTQPTPPSVDTRSAPSAEPSEAPWPDAFDQIESSSVRLARAGRGQRGTDPAAHTISAAQARASARAGSRSRLQQVTADAEANRRDENQQRPSPEELLKRGAPSRPRARTEPAPRVGSTEAATPRYSPSAPKPPVAAPSRPRPAAHTEPAGRPVAEEPAPAQPFSVPGTTSSSSPSARPSSPMPASNEPASASTAPSPAPVDGSREVPTRTAVAPPASGGVSDGNATTHADDADLVSNPATRDDEPPAADELSNSIEADPAASDDVRDADVAEPTDGNTDAAVGDVTSGGEPDLPSMRVGDDSDSAGRPFSFDELAMDPRALRDQLLERPIAEILGLGGPRSRKVVNEVWKRRQKQVEATWPRLTPDVSIRAGRSDLLRLLNSTMRVLTVPRELRRWQAREKELGRPALYADLFEFTATSVAERPSTLREANARLAELARDEKLAGSRLPRMQKGSTDGLDPAVVAAGFTNEMLDAAGKKRPGPSIGEQRRTAEQKRMRVYAGLLILAVFLVFLSWTNACPSAMGP